MGENSASSALEDRLALLERNYADLQKRYEDLQGALAERNKAGREAVNAESEVENGKKEDKATIETSEEIQNLRVRIVTSRVDPDTGERKDFPSDQDLQGAGNVKRAEYPILLRKILHKSRSFSGEISYTSGEIEIFDPGLLELLRDLLRHYPYHFFLGDTVPIPSPYEPFILNWDILLEESRKETGCEKQRQIRLNLQELLETILKGSGDEKLDSYMQARSSLRKERSITFEALWTIFPPGTIVYGRAFLKEHQIFLVEDNFESWPDDYEPMPDDDRRSLRRSSSNRLKWDLKCWIYDFTGERFERRNVTLTFEEFEGAKPIASLPFHPLEENENRDNIEQTLLKRGELFRKYCTAREDERMYSYNGQAKLDRKGFRGVHTDPSEAREYPVHFPRDFPLRRRGEPRAAPTYLMIDKGDVMVDFESYYRYGREIPQVGELNISESTDECACRYCASNAELRSRLRQHYDGKTGKEDEKWEDLQFRLCPPRVLGYILKDKQWAQLAVKDLTNIPEKDPKQELAGLRLGDDGAERKELLLSLVKHHGIDEARGDFKDIVPEKGKGLVVLLYGQPGVGKTSTAQMIAMATGKPLFPVGVADVGTDAKFVESNLETIFRLASTWKAILLIDEADVFLQSRTGGSFGGSAERNALVSVFLRVLEYYRGILFLTTNQIAQFDVAVQSRIHIALRYDELTKEQSKDIFLDFVDQYKKKGMVTGYEAIKKYAGTELYKGKEKYDGRQIRNIVTSAVGYAKGLGDDTMSLEHIRHVASNMYEFKTDLKGQMTKWKEAQNLASI